jgi:hypothetical protein
MTERHDTGRSRPHIGGMTTHTSAMGREASALPAADHPAAAVPLGRLWRARTRLGQASVGMGPLAWVGVRSVVLITVSMLVILVGLPAALVAAGN